MYIALSRRDYNYKRTLIAWHIRNQLLLELLANASVSLTE